MLFSDVRRFQNEYAETVQTLTRESVDYLPFMSPATRRQFSEDGLRSVYQDTGDLFYGIGEIALYAGPMEGNAFTEPPLPGYVNICADNDLVIMVHPTRENVEGINQVLPQYSDVDFIMHGFQTVRRSEASDTADALLEQHDNLYWTYDGIEMSNGLYTRASGKNDFIERFDANRSQFLERTLERLPQLLEVAPNRILWGTDVATEWNMDPDVYDQGIELTGNVIDALPADHREPYAYGNAVELFGG